MSTCISRHGEYGSHEIGSGEDEFTCQRCFVFDEGAALTALRDARAEIERLRSLTPDEWLMNDYADAVRERNAAEAELAAERAKVERVRALRTEWAQRSAEDRNHELWRALGVALTGGEQ